MVELERQELMKIAAKRPQILLPLQELMDKVTDPIDMNNLKELIYRINVPKEVKPEVNDTIQEAVTRFDKLNIPHFRQDFPQRLVKLNQIEYEVWNTPFIKSLLEQFGSKEEDEQNQTNQSKRSGPLRGPLRAPPRTEG